jgi:hypothetical protein
MHRRFLIVTVMTGVLMAPLCPPSFKVRTRDNQDDNFRRSKVFVF